MLDSFVRPLIDPPLNVMARLLAKTPLTGTGLTIIGFVFGLGCFLCVMMQYTMAALIFLLLNRLCDGLDGSLARVKNQTSDFGGFLDIFLDFMIYAGLPFFMALSLMSETAFLAVAFVLYGMIASGVSFLAYAIMAAKRGDETKAQGKKSFYFSAGLMEGSETIIFMILIIVLPQWFEILCYVFGTLCFITGAGRIALSRQAFQSIK